MNGDTEQDTLPDGVLLGLDEVGAAPVRGRGPAKGRGPLDQAETNGIPITETLPVARVVLDLQPAHLDQPYDYLVPATMADDAQPGVRIKARFGRQDVAGYVVARQETSDHDGRLVPLRRVVSGEQVLTPQVLELCRAVADRYAGTLADVLRLALPPRHARVEKEPVAAEPGSSRWSSLSRPRWPSRSSPPRWAPYRGGEAYLRRIQAGEAPRAVWSALPGVGTGSDVTARRRTGRPPSRRPWGHAWRASVGRSSSCRTPGTRRA